MVIRRTVRAVVYDVLDGERIYLLLKTKHDYWQNPQGGIETGEGELEALLRETDEETGLDAYALVPTRVYTEYDTRKDGSPVHSTLAAYAVNVDCSGPVILSQRDGHTDYMWATYDEALSLLTEYPEQRTVFEDVVRKLDRLGW